MIDLDALVQNEESRALLEIVRSGSVFPQSSLERATGSVARSQPPDDRERLSRLVDSLQRHGSAVGEENQPNPDLVREVVRGAQEGLAKAQSSEARLRRRELFGLEAVILTDGTRPSLTIRNGFVDLEGPEVGDWKLPLTMFRDAIRRVIAAVGRVNVPGPTGFVGTCFLVADDLVATNRHVLEEIADETSPGNWTFRFPDQTTVDFLSEEGSAATARFPLRAVVYSPPDPILRTIHFPHLDLALLRVDFGGAASRPAPVRCESDLAPLGVGRELYVVGFPVRPQAFFGTGAPPAGKETAEVMESVFGWKFGVKKLAPGRVTAATGQLPGDVKSWVFSHNGSTLGGNSGSCLVDLGIDGARVIGIHFGGEARVQNWAHSFAAVRGRVGALGMDYI